MGIAARLSAVALIAVTAVVAGCASGPKQTVQLADVVDEQIVQMQGSHERFVRLYYDGLRKDVDEFLEHKWTPQFLANVIQGKGAQSKAFRDELDRGYKLANIDWKQAVKVEVDDPDVRKALEETLAGVGTRQSALLGQTLIDFSNAAQVQIEKRRRTLIDPINEQEGFVLDQLREGYADIFRGNAALRGYLASVVNLTENRDKALAQVGLLEKQRELMDDTMRVSQQAVDALDKAEQAQDGLDQALALLKSWKGKLKTKP